jgi:hypothetical protein
MLSSHHPSVNIIFKLDNPKSEPVSRVHSLIGKSRPKDSISLISRKLSMQVVLHSLITDRHRMLIYPSVLAAQQSQDYVDPDSFGGGGGDGY